MRNGWISLHALFFLLATALPGWPQASGPSTEPQRIITSYLMLAAERAGLVGELKDNLAEKRVIDQEYTDLGVAETKHTEDVAAASAFCQGSFLAEELERRRQICAVKKRETEAAAAMNVTRRNEISARDRKRQAEGLRLKASYEALAQRVKTTETAIDQNAALKPAFDLCRSQTELTTRAQCVADRWAVAKPKFPEPPVPLVGVSPQEPDPIKVAEDWAILELAAKVYGMKTMPGQSPFAGNQDWKMLEIADARALPEMRAALKAMGFNAYSYVNEGAKTLVVAVQGSRLPGLDSASHPDTRADLVQDWWINDLKKGLISGQTPPQFEIARQYVQAVKEAYGNKYTIVCSGHSLGGGACAYAAGMEGVRAVVLNPISSSASTLPKNAHLIDNYVVENELAITAYGIAGRPLIGRHYKINNYRESGGGMVKTIGGTLVDHGADVALGNLAKQVGIERIK